MKDASNHDLGRLDVPVPLRDILNIPRVLKSPIRLDLAARSVLPLSATGSSTPSGGPMDFNFWKERWDSGRIGFHQGEVNRHLARFIDRIASPHASGVLVPLCGKAVDLTFLGEHFERVVGVEFVESAVVEYFAERELTPERREIDGIPAYRGASVTLLAADFHAVTLAHTGPIQRAFDRAALIALPPDVRPRYAAHLLSLLPPGGRILLVTMIYEQRHYSGPPFSVTEEEVRGLYGATCDLEVLSREPARRVPDALEGHDVQKIIWLITKR